MKKNNLTAKGITDIFFKSRCILMAILLWAAAYSGQAQPSPVGTWDCVIKGGESGTAWLTFNSDFSVEGMKIIVPRIPKPDALIPIVRSLTGSRDDEGTDDGGSGVVTNEFGGLQIGGTWGFDQSGRVIGFYTEVASDLEGALHTNAVPFRAVVRPGSRLVLLARVPNGKVTLKGVPFVSLPDLSGSWYGTGRRSGARMVEFFSLAPDGQSNSYDLNGEGPGYVLEGSVMVSSLRRISLVMLEVQMGEEGPTPAALRALTGSFNRFRLSGSTKGFDSNDAKIKYKIVKQ